MEPKLNYFIAGAPKCGTTSLFHYLTQHPNVYDTGFKEINFFCEDFPTARGRKDFASYMELFSRVTEHDLAIGEASVVYMFSTVAPRLMHDRFPDARIILMFRNPIELVHALHMQNLSTFNEDEADFATAWALQEERAKGRSIPAKCSEPFFLQYREFGLLGKHLQRMLEVYPADQFKYVLQEDFRVDTRGVYEDVLDFLELPPFPDVDLQPQNKSHAPRSAWFASSLDSALRSAPVRQLMRLKNSLLPGPSGISEKLRQMNRKTAPRQPLDEAFAAELRREFAADVALLGELTGRNLEHWMR